MSQASNASFGLSLQSKQLSKDAVKAQKEAENQKMKVKKAIERGDYASARVYAESAIRQENSARQFNTMGAKLQGVNAQLKQQQTQARVISQLDQVNAALAAAGSQLDPIKAGRVLNSFDKNMDQFDDISQALNMQLDKATASQAPTSEVDNLIAQVCAEHRISFQQSVSVPSGPISTSQSMTLQNPQLQPMAMGGYQSSPSQNYQPSKQNYQPSNQNYQPSNQNYQPSNQNYQPSNQNYQPSNQNYQPPNQNYQPSNQNYQPPNQNYQPPSQNYQPSNQNYQPPPSQNYNYQPNQNYQQQSQSNYPPVNMYQNPPLNTSNVEDDLESRLKRLMQD